LGEDQLEVIGRILVLVVLLLLLPFL
jgi:hypothetical protein